MPFTMPDKKESFTPISENEIDDKTLLKGGFRSLGQFKWHSVFRLQCFTIFKKSESIRLL